MPIWGDVSQLSCAIDGLKIREEYLRSELMSSRREHMSTQVQLNELLTVLMRHCGERGDNEGALETLERLMGESDSAYTRLCVVASMLNAASDASLFTRLAHLLRLENYVYSGLGLVPTEE